MSGISWSFQYGNPIYLGIIITALIVYFACSSVIKNQGGTKKTASIVLSIIGLLWSAIELFWSAMELHSFTSSFFSKHVTGITFIYSVVFWVFMILVFLILLFSKNSSLCLKVCFIIPVLLLIYIPVLWIYRLDMNTLFQVDIPKYTWLFDLQFLIYACIIGLPLLRLKKKARIYFLRGSGMTSAN